jgi:hypothetical protein
MPTFRNTPPRNYVLHPEGDYELTVRAIKALTSTGPATRGSDMYEVTFAIDPEGEIVDRLIDHPSCNWKLDALLKACGVDIQLDEEYELTQERAEINQVRHIDLRGLTCLAHLTVEEFQSNRTGKMLKTNKVHAYLFDGIRNTERPSKSVATVKPAAFDDEDDEEDDFTPF